MPPPLEIDRLNEKAVLFLQTGVDDSGERVHDSGSEIDVKWDHRVGQATLANGETVVIDARVVVDRDVPVGSLMWEGQLQDWMGTGSNDYGQPLCEVIGFSRHWDMKGRTARRVAFLMRRRDG